MEQQLKLSRLQVHDLLKRRQEVYAVKEKIENVDTRLVKKQHKRCLGLRAAIKRRLEGLHSSILSMQKNDVSRSSELHLSPSVGTSSQQLPPQPAPEVEESPRSEVDCLQDDSLHAWGRDMDRAEAAFGLWHGPDFAKEVVEKLRTSKRLTEALHDERRQLEAPMAALKAEHAALSKTLDEARLTGSAGSVRDQQRVDDDSACELIRCKQAMRRAERAELVIQGV